jgi:hypothetical protein
MSGDGSDIVRPGVSSSYIKAQDIRHVDADEVAALLGRRPRGDAARIWVPYYDAHRPDPFG